MAVTAMDGANRSTPEQHRRKRRRVAVENRQRATVACSNCRRLKEKCNGQVPCERCTKHGRHCQIAPSDPKPPRSSIPSSKSESSEERIHYLEAIAEHFLDEVPVSNAELRQVAIDLKAQEGSSDEQNSGVAETPGLEKNNFTTVKVSNGTVHYSGELSHWNFSERLREFVENGPAQVCNGTSLVFKDFWRADDLRCSETVRQLETESLPPWEVAIFLLDTYFGYAQTNTMFIEREWATERLARLYNSVQTLGKDDAAWICAILAALAIGAQFAHMEGGLKETAVTIDGASDDAVATALYRLAAKFIPDTLVLASLESVQACLLFAHFALPLDTHNLGYTYAGMAIHLAIQNGMHRMYRGSDLSEEDIDLRNRLWWTCWTLEMRITVLHGRPSSTLDAYKDAGKPKDTGTPDRTRELVLIRLIEGLQDFSNSLNRLQRCAPRLRGESLQAVIKSKLSFEKWWADQPVSRMPVMNQCRRSAQLHLYYHISIVYLCRPFTLSRGYGRQQPSTTTQASGPLEKLAEDAVTSACHLVDILAVMDSTIGLARASYIEFSACRASTMVILAASLTNKTEELTLKRGLAMQFINKMALTIAASQSDASLLTAIDACIRRMDERADALKRDATALNTESEQAKYDTFKKWACERQEELESYPAPVDSAQPTTAGDLEDFADMESLFGGFDWNLFDPSLLGPDDNNLFADFGNL